MTGHPLVVVRGERAELQVLWDLGVCDSISLTGNVRQPAGRLQIREPRPQRLELLITPEAVHFDVALFFEVNHLIGGEE